MVQFSKPEVLGLVALFGTSTVVTYWLFKRFRVFPPEPCAKPQPESSEDEEQSPPRWPKVPSRVVRISRVQQASGIQGKLQEMRKTQGARQGGAGPSTESLFQMKIGDPPSVEHSSLIALRITRRGATQTTIQCPHSERDFSPVLLEIFTSLTGSDSGQLENELRRIQQGQAWQGVTGDVSVIALVYHVPILIPEATRALSEDPAPYADEAWRIRQETYAVTLGQNIIRNTPQIVVHGSVSADNVRTLACFIRFVRRSFALAIQEPKLYLKENWNMGTPCLFFSFRLDLRWTFCSNPPPGVLVMVAVYETEPVCKCNTGQNPRLDSRTRKFVVRKLQACDTVDSRYQERAVAVELVTELWEGFCLYNIGVVVFLQCRMEVWGARHFKLEKQVQDTRLKRHLCPNNSVGRALEESLPICDTDELEHTQVFPS